MIARSSATQSMLLCASRAQRSPFFKPRRGKKARAWLDASQQLAASNRGRSGPREVSCSTGCRRLLRAGRKCFPEIHRAHSDRGRCPHLPSGAKLRSSDHRPQPRRAALACPDEDVRAYVVRASRMLRSTASNPCSSAANNLPSSILLCAWGTRDSAAALLLRSTRPCGP